MQDTKCVRGYEEVHDVAGILVGATCSVAPKAKLTYYAVPSWKSDNTPYTQALHEIIDQNEKHPLSERIRVVSISTGLFSQQKHAGVWKAAMRRASKHGLLVITCDPSAVNYGTLDRKPGTSPDDPEGYVTGKYTMSSDALRVPAGHRTTAGHQGKDVYTYWTDGGMSWATPYLAGLAALAYQQNPQLSPATVQRLLQESATKTQAGRVLNPALFLESVISADRESPPAATVLTSS